MGKSFNPEMLILARESRGLTQTAFARRLKTTQGAVSKYESGLLEVSSDHLERACDVLGYPKQFFYLQEQRFGFGSSCFYHRKRSTMPVGELRVIQAQINVCRIHASKLLQGAEIESENQFVRLDIEDFDSPAHVAQELRANWRLPMGPVNDLLGAIEGAGGLVFECDFNTKKLDAISQWVPGLPPLFFVNSSIPGDRLRFTLCHELGHVIMHQLPTEDREREADTFAAEFLMPAKEITPQLTNLSMGRLAALKRYWKVSMAALIKRAADLDTISQRQYRSWFTRLSKNGYRVNEPFTIPPERPTVVNELINVYLQENQYSVSELADYLCVNEHELRALYLPAVEPTLRVVK